MSDEFKEEVGSLSRAPTEIMSQAGSSAVGSVSEEDENSSAGSSPAGDLLRDEAGESEGRRGRAYSSVDDMSRGSGSERKRRGGAGGGRNKKFRMQAKQYALTYPQCPVVRAAFDAEFNKRFSPHEYASARESHQDGNYHMHVFVAFKSKKNVQSARYFDVSIEGSTYHPNIQKCRSRDHWLQYIAKGDDHGVADLVQRGPVGFDPLSEPLGKRKSKYLDYKWSQEYEQRSKLLPVNYPVRLVTADRTYEMLKPSPIPKKRSWWVVAEPNAGKTRWVNRVFSGQRIFCPRTGKYPFEGYDDEDIIIYDDREGVTFAEFSSVLNTWDIPMPIAGEIRYVTQYWKRGHTRSCIVLSNKTIEESMPPEDVVRMKKRFIQIVNPVLAHEDDVSDPDEAVAEINAEIDADIQAAFAS